MTDAELARLFRRLGRDLDARQRAQLQRLRLAERQFFDALMQELEDTLNVEGGFIVSRVSNPGIQRAFDRALRTVQQGALGAMQRATIADVKGILSGNAQYYGSVWEGKGYGETKATIQKALNKRLGIDGSKVIKGGYLDNVFSQTFFGQEVRDAITTGIAQRLRMSQLRRQLEVTIKGTQKLDGAITREYSELVVDTYHQTDRAASSGFGQALKFKWAVYEGGLIETSRQFCIERDGKVFNSVEAERWRHDPKLPKTTKERESGIVVNYTPLANLSNAAGSTATSMGRWRCRHRTRWISEQMARRLAPEKFN